MNEKIVKRKSSVKRGGKMTEKEMLRLKRSIENDVMKKLKDKMKKTLQKEREKQKRELQNAKRHMEKEVKAVKNIMKTFKDKMKTDRKKERGIHRIQLQNTKRERFQRIKRALLNHKQKVKEQQTRSTQQIMATLAYTIQLGQEVHSQSMRITNLAAECNEAIEHQIRRRHNPSGSVRQQGQEFCNIVPVITL